MREMAKKNLEKMVKGAAREVNTSRPASRDGRAGASAAPVAAKKPAADAPAKSAAAPEPAAPAKALVDKAGTVSEDKSAPAAAKSGAATEVASSSGSSATNAAASSKGADSDAKATVEAEAPAASMKTAGAADAKASAVNSARAAEIPVSSTKAAGSSASSGKNVSAADVASSSAKAPGVPASVFEQLQVQIQKNGKTIQKVPVESIQLNENIREAYSDEHLKTLADSMQKDGLIQFPTLCLKAGANGEFTFVCKNGHRRILAAKSLGWKTIECVILPFASTRDELYHTIAANLREDVFYLDLAQAYQQANHLGESDQAIAERVGVNPRTVGWYRRLTGMAPECQALCRQYPDLFHATWAIQLARKGELPPLAVLMKQMQFMLARYQALKNNADQAAQPDRLPKTIDAEQQREAKASLKSLFSGARGSTEAQQAWQLVEQLCIAGYFKPALLNRMRRQLLSGAQKSSRRTPAAES
jgi:ParB-like chromosome segregation protein Spo0J